MEEGVGRLDRGQENRGLWRTQPAQPEPTKTCLSFIMTITTRGLVRSSVDVVEWLFPVPTFDSNPDPAVCSAPACHPLDDLTPSNLHENENKQSKLTTKNN